MAAPKRGAATGCDNNEMAPHKPPSHAHQGAWPALPLGLCTVASGLAAAGHEVEVLDLMFVSDVAKETQQVVLQPAHGGTDARLAGRQPELVLLLTQRLVKQ